MRLDAAGVNTAEASTGGSAGIEKRLVSKWISSS